VSALNVGVFGENPQAREAFAHELAKKASADDLAFYHTTYAGRVLTVIDPAGYPARVQPLLYAARLTQYSAILADQLSPALGETIVALDALGKRAGCFITSLDVSPLVKGTSLEGFPVFATLAEAREGMLAYEGKAAGGPVRALVDHAFDVKGVGTVVLGVVERGTLKVHDKLIAYPNGKAVEVRSIQKQDRDVTSAECFDRYGASLKNVTSPELERGTVLSASPLRVETRLEVEAEASRFLRAPLGGEGGREVVHACAGLQVVPATLEGRVPPGGRARVALSLQKPLAFDEGEPLVLLRLDAKGLRVAGRARL
jgi:selenocysteine-specific translation elongation factor